MPRTDNLHVRTVSKFGSFNLLEPSRHVIGMCMFRHISNSHPQEATTYTVQSDRSYCMQLVHIQVRSEYYPFRMFYAVDFDFSLV